MRLRLTVYIVLLVAVGVSGCDKEDQAQTYLERGNTLFEKGDFVKARLEFKNVLQIDPQQPHAWFMLGQIDEREQNWRPAFQAYARAVELDPDNHLARIKRGTLLFAADQPDEALEEAEAVLAGDADNPAALALRGAIKAAQGDLQGAAADAQAALALDAAQAEALVLLADVRRQQGEPEEARTLLEQAVAAHPEQVAIKVALARAYEMLGQTAEVIAVLEQIAAQQPDAFAPKLQLARYLAAKGQPDVAEETLRAAVAADPADRERKLMLVQFVQETKGAEAALAELQRWIEADPDDNELRFQLAEGYGAAGQLDAMVATYETIIEKNRESADAVRARGRLAALALARGEPDQALALAEELLASDDANADALLVRAAVQLQRNEVDQVIADLRTLLRDDPESVGALRLLAQAHERRDEVALAEDVLQTATEAAPDNAPAHLQLAELRLRTGDPAGASQVLEAFLSRVPDDDAVQTALARLQLSQQDTAALATTAERVLSTRPELPLGYYLKGLLLQQEVAHEAAIAQFETALQKKPGAAEPLIALARSYLTLEQPQRAEQRLQQLLDEDPDNVIAMNLLGEVYLAQGRRDDAREHYASIVRAKPRVPFAYDRLARLQVAGGDQAGALETLQTGVEITGRNALLLQTLGLLQQQAGDLDAAMAAYEEVLKKVPTAAVAANNLAMLIANRETDDPARMARAQEITEPFAESEQAGLVDTAGWVQYRSGNYGRAVELLEKAASLGLQSPEHHYHLGMAYLKVDRADEGKTLIAKAVEASPATFPGIDEARAVLEAAP